VGEGRGRDGRGLKLVKLKADALQGHQNRAAGRRSEGTVSLIKCVERT